MTSDPLRLTVVYERAENGWTTRDGLPVRVPQAVRVRLLRALPQRPST